MAKYSAMWKILVITERLERSQQKKHKKEVRGFSRYLILISATLNEFLHLCYFYGLFDT